MVYILNRGVAELICLEDSNGNNQRRWLLENEGVSFKGNPPFKAISNNLKQFDIYYQGYKVQPALLDQGVLLKEVEVN